MDAPYQYIGAEYAFMYISFKALFAKILILQLLEAFESMYTPTQAKIQIGLVLLLALKMG
jgi:hypothetical protein